MAFKSFAILSLLLLAMVVVDAFSGFRRGQMTMKTRNGKIPVNQRGEFMKRQKMIQAREQFVKQAPKDVPMFEIYCRPKSGGIWVPCGSFAGDKKAASLCNAWASGFMSDMYKSTLDKGVARSVYAQEDALYQGIKENIKVFQKFEKDDLEFGYKVKFEPIEEKLGETLDTTTVLVKGMERGWLDNVKDSIAGILAPKS